MVVKISFDDGNKLNQVLEALSSINEEVEFLLDEKGMSTRDYDPERVVMIDLWMSKEMMREYDLGGLQRFRFRVQLSELKKLKIKSTPVTLVFDGKKCVVQQEKPYMRAFSLPLLDTEPNPKNGLLTPPLKCEFEAEAKLTLEGLCSIIDDAKLCTDFVRVYATQEILRFSNSNILSYEAELKKDETKSLLWLEVKAESKTTFSLKHFDQVIRSAASLGEIVLLKFKTDFPIALYFETKDPNTLSVMFAFAPRIEPES
jgi:DNA polymerase III sliding clamp (beta) subunit (PCNA family)